MKTSFGMLIVSQMWIAAAMISSGFPQVFSGIMGVAWWITSLVQIFREAKQ